MIHHSSLIIPNAPHVHLRRVLAAVTLALILLTSCKTTKPVPQIIVVQDSIRTEVRTETVYIHDTIPVALPKDSVAVVIPDTTTSRLETSVAISEATIRDGLLHHSIWNKPSIDVPVDHKETVRDSIVYREKEVPVPYPVEVEVPAQLTWWQQLRLWLGTAALILLAIVAVWKGVQWWVKRQL